MRLSIGIGRTARSGPVIRVVVAAAIAALATLAGHPQPAAAQPVKNRISVLVDSSGSMLLTPEIVTFADNCTAFNPCSYNGSISTSAQRTCNACVRDTITYDSFCNSFWDSQCRSEYTQCVLATTGQSCTANMVATNGLSTRGDGSNDLPGCDVDGDGQANDSRMYQAKEALANVVGTFGEVEFSLWRYAQVTGGQTCTTDGQCPDTPGGASILTCEDHDNNAGTARVCALDADILDFTTTAGYEGQCEIYTYTGSPSSFTCNVCDALNTYDRALCDVYDLDRVRTGAVSPLNGTSVTCFPTSNPQHRFMRYHGGIDNGGVCDPTGAQRLVDFPATGWGDNYSQIISWIDHNQNPFSTTDELRPQGGTPIAASLRDMRTAVLANATADTKTPCRKHQVVLLTDGGESCESVAAAISAAGTFQNMSFTNAAGVFVPDYDVPVYVIGFAICPPSNMNCQTRQDLDAIAAAGGTSSAILVNNQLELQLALAQIVASSVVSERCNDLDDDCDTLIDEDFPGKGSSCSVGVGACFSTGTVQCTANQLGLECSATPGTPSPEVCNGIDDNCDGLVDNGINCTGCVPQCTSGCDICNGLDEDCDGTTDEDFTPAPCGLSIGACQPGTTTCVAGMIGCSGGVGPMTESCNNIDDDCDNIVDGMTQPCYPGGPGCDTMTGTCQGICRFGTQTCTAGMFGACTGAVTPGTEIACNLLDDDCDGSVDEGSGVEQCNGLDDDCDGSIDEGVAATDPDIGTSCGTPPFTGVCQPGTIQCVAGSEQCVGEVDPGTEACNNLDDDCDGMTDEMVPGFGGACGSSTGQCQPGTLQCVAGQPECVGTTGPFTEVCNGLDDNCNGFTDETDPMLGNQCNTTPSGQTVTTEDGECQFGVLACQAGGLVCVGAVGPTAELCNGLDDDCDNMIDEDFPVGTACTNGEDGVCNQPGVYVCNAAGNGVSCTAPPGTPGTEVCNDLDDDCDGMTDEAPLPLVDTVCAPGVGVCSPGLWSCQNGMLVCGTPGSGNPEVCDGDDNDCDALVDESPPGAPLPGEELPCVEPGFEMYGDTGECEFGQTECLAGAIECVGYVGPSPEICDGLDNDCDGMADDMATCPSANNVCTAGECVNPCGVGEFPCPAGYTCMQLDNVPMPGRYCVPDPCANVACPSGEACDPTDGTCHDLCENVMCRTGEECRAGFCLDCFDLPDQCGPMQLCIADGNNVGQCQDNPCDPNPCQPDEVCTDGTCSSACQGGCPQGQVCVAGTCQGDACDGVRCPPGQVCDPADGTCAVDECDGVSCLPGEVCVPTTGDCQPDPCATTVCPSGTVCTVDGGGRPVCDVPRPPDSDRVTAAGGGCAAGGGAGGGRLAALLAGLALVVAVRRRRRSLPTGGGRS